MVWFTFRYLVELADGLCLAAFASPAVAVLWGLQLVEALKHEDWDEELLAHELCEQVRARRRGAGSLGLGSGLSRSARAAPALPLRAGREVVHRRWCTGGGVIGLS